MYITLTTEYRLESPVLKLTPNPSKMLQEDNEQNNHHARYHKNNIDKLVYNNNAKIQ